MSILSINKENYNNNLTINQDLAMLFVPKPAKASRDMILAMKNINVILFDFVGVLSQKSPTYIPDKIADMIDSVIGDVVDDDAFRSSMVTKLNLSNQEFNKKLDIIVEKYEAFAPLWEILPLLRKKYRLGIINNGTALTLPQLEKKYKLNCKFDFFVSSALVHIKKPDPAIYFYAMDLFDSSPDQCLFIDDSLDNVRAAEEIGIHAMHWNSNQRLDDLINLALTQNI